MGVLKHYKFDLFVTVLTVGAIVFGMGLWTLVPLLILIVLEISFSFDNAVVNAKYLKRLSHAWQVAFLTIGILIAVFGMRLVFPIAIVAITADLSWGQVIDLALNDSHAYAEKLEAAHPQIATFGGVFLLMIFLDFIFDDKREVLWLERLERPLAKVGRLDAISVLVALVTILVLSGTVGSEHQLDILLSGLISLATYMGVGALSDVFADESDEDEETSGKNFVPQTGMAAFGTFMFLEVQDASFSFDGVAGAFAITDHVVLIAAGLGIGALFVRSMTVHLVRTGKLEEFRYLEHGAHWAIGVLSICMLASLGMHIPEWITGLTGVVFITFAVWHSHKANLQDELDAGNGDDDGATSSPEPASV